MIGERRNSNIEWQPSARLRTFVSGIVRCSMFLFLPYAAMAATDSTNAFIAPPVEPVTAREFYNAGTRSLHAGKLAEAEQMFSTALGCQDEKVQPVTLYNLGEVRFGQGLEELKKSSANSTTTRSRAALASANSAITEAEAALASNDLTRMIEAYMDGSGARKELRAATEAVRKAMQSYGKTLGKWRRSLGDFRSANELDPLDTGASHNAEIVSKAIAKLVDSLREMQQAAMPMSGTQARLNELMRQLRGRIPAPNMPPGAPGDSDDEDQMPMESLKGMKEEGQSEGGQEREIPLSAEDAGRLLDGMQNNGKLLPMARGEEGKPRDRKGKTW